MIQITQPVKGKLKIASENGIITQFFGDNFDWYFQNAGTNGHNGIDLVWDFNSAEKDEFIYSAHSGLVVNAKWNTHGGNTITIVSAKLSDGTMLASVYAHNSELYVKAGDFVSEDQKIAKMGATGDWCFGKHCHFGLYLYSDPIPGTYQVGYAEVGKSYSVLNINNGFKGALNPLFYFKESFMKYVIIGNEQYLLYDPLKLAFNIGDGEELQKLVGQGLQGSPVPVASLPTGYVEYPLVGKARIKDIFGINN